MISCSPCTCYPTLFLSSSSIRRDSTNLLHNNLSWIHTINNSEKPCNLSFVSWHHLQINNKVIPLLCIKQSEFVDVVSISKIIHFSSILLQFECFKQLINWQARKFLYFWWFTSLLVCCSLAIETELFWLFIPSILWVLNSQFWFWILTCS